MAAIGFVLSHEQFTAPRLIEFGQLAEQAGFDMVWTSDHFLPWMDNQGHAGQAWVTLAALSQHIHIPMGTGVTCPTYRYSPAIVAQVFASLGVFAPGKIFLGVGTGEAINEQGATGHWEEYEDRADRLVEAVELIRRLWSGEWVDHIGKHYNVSGKIYDLPQQQIPVYMAASGPQSMEAAGQHGDGLITDAKSALDPEMREAFNQGARQAGKNPEEMTIHAETFVFVGDKNSAEARHAAEMWRFIPNAWTEFVHNPDPRDIMRKSQAEIPLEKAMESWVAGADPETHIQAIQKLIDGGVTHIYIHSGQDDQERVIDFYGREVLPRVQHERMRVMAYERV
jgi:F420-dependent hydroxymycolic acid dehydrogenase